MRLDQRRKSPLTQQIHKLKLSNTNTRKSILAGPGYYSGGNASRISGSLLKGKTQPFGCLLMRKQEISLAGCNKLLKPNVWAAYRLSSLKSQIYLLMKEHYFLQI